MQTTEPNIYEQSPAAWLPPQPRGQWWAPAASFCLGVLALVLYAFPASESVNEEALTPVTGIASNVTTSMHRKRFGAIECLKFTVGGYRASLSEYHPRYPAVRSAVTGGKKLQAWFETKARYNDDTNPLRKLVVNQEVLVSPADQGVQDAKNQDALLLGGVGLLCLASLTAALAMWKQIRYERLVAELAGRPGK